MTYAEQLEHETEGTRRRVAETLHELREAATPGLREGDGALLTGNFSASSLKIQWRRRLSGSRGWSGAGGPARP